MQKSISNVGRERTLESADGYKLTATVYEPQPPSRRSHGTVLIHSATATPQVYYRRFAEYLAAAGHRVITYDYRGIGQSRQGSLRHFSANMNDWSRDAQAAIAFSQTFGGALVSIGHSFGGQLIGLIDEAREVDGAILVASQMGAVRHWPLGRRMLYSLAWYILVPLLSRLYGYVPAWAGIGEDLPGGVARQWASWCRSHNYLVDHVKDAEARFSAFTAPTVAYSFTDDGFAPKTAVEALLSQLRRSNLLHRHVSPSSLGVEKIDHFGLFREPMRERLWPELRQFIDDIAAGRVMTAPQKPAAFTLTEAEVMLDLDYGR